MKTPINDSATTSPLSFLFALWEGGGNTPPALSVARRLLNMGHSVRVLGDSCQRKEIERSGAQFLPWTIAPNRQDKTSASDPIRDWEVSNPLKLMARLRDCLFFGPAAQYAADTLNELRRERTDCVVSSEMLFGPAIAAESFGVSSVFLASNIYLYPREGVPPFGPGFFPARNFIERARDRLVSFLSYREYGKATHIFNNARAELGLPPLRHPFEQIERVQGFLVLSSEHFDFPSPKRIQNLVYAGPELDDPNWVEPWQSPWSHEDTRPLVLVSLSTTFQNQKVLLQKIADALFQLPVRAVITTGPSLDPREIRGGENTHLCQSAPHNAILPGASAMITHCGHGSVMRGLAAGVPLLCLPMGRDQNDNAARVTARGAGLQLNPKASVADISHALSRLLHTAEYRTAAVALGQKLRFDFQNSQAVSALEAWARVTRNRQNPGAVPHTQVSNASLQLHFELAEEMQQAYFS